MHECMHTAGPFAAGVGAARGVRVPSVPPGRRPKPTTPGAPRNACTARQWQACMRAPGSAPSSQTVLLPRWSNLPTRLSVSCGGAGASGAAGSGARGRGMRDGAGGGAGRRARCWRVARRSPVLSPSAPGTARRPGAPLRRARPRPQTRRPRPCAHDRGGGGGGRPAAFAAARQPRRAAANGRATERQLPTPHSVAGRGALTGRSAARRSRGGGWGPRAGARSGVLTV